MITQEMTCIDIDLFDNAAQAQLNDTPIVPRCAAAAGLPSIHPFAAVGVLIRDEDSAARLEEVFLLGEELVVRDKGDAADAGSRQIDKACGWRWRRIVRIHASVGNP